MLDIQRVLTIRIYRKEDVDDMMIIIIIIVMINIIIIMTGSIVDTVSVSVKESSKLSQRPEYITEAPIFILSKLIHLKVLVTYFFKCSLNEPGYNSTVQKRRVRAAPLMRNK